MLSFLAGGINGRWSEGTIEWRRKRKEYKQLRGLFFFGLKRMQTIKSLVFTSITSLLSLWPSVEETFKLAVTCSKSTKDTLKIGVKYIES